MAIKKRNIYWFGDFRSSYGNMPMIDHQTNNLKIDEHLYLVNCVDNGNIKENVYFECFMDERPVILTKDEIYDYLWKNALLKQK